MTSVSDLNMTLNYDARGSDHLLDFEQDGQTVSVPLTSAKGFFEGMLKQLPEIEELVAHLDTLSPEEYRIYMIERHANGEDRKELWC